MRRTWVSRINRLVVLGLAAIIVLTAAAATIVSGPGNAKASPGGPPWGSPPNSSPAPFQP
jgi:hypothetical protein